MALQETTLQTVEKRTPILLRKMQRQFARVPLLGWLISAIAAALVEHLIGYPLAIALGMGTMPSFFGFEIALSRPQLFPSAVLYIIVVYILPIVFVAWLSASMANRLAAWLLRFPTWVSLVIHLALLYLVLHLWAVLGDYRVLLLKLVLIAIMTTLSLNVVNGYMGEFSCSHPGFMALGAYSASVMTVLFFVNDSVFGPPLLPPAIGPYLFPIVLILAGLVASLGAIIIAIPSFRTRGDYLAIISLAFTFIVKSFFENLEIVGGPRGFMGQPDWASLPFVYVVTVLCVLIINNFVNSIFGKAMNAVRDGETAAEAMTIDTRKTKMTAFLFSAFWAGVAGGLLAHVLRYVNPATFGILKLSEVLAMLYLGGLNSVVGSIVGAVGFNILSEMLRPLELIKWIVIAVLVILVMIFRPTGLIAFKELKIEDLLKPKSQMKEEIHATSSD
jgi:branched-chain amino acid transport system permease protein